jgi:hypothetical protein
MNTELIAKWEQCKLQIESLKKLEIEFRNEILKQEFQFDENKCESGTKNLDLDNGFKLKAVFKTTQTLDQVKVLQVYDVIKTMHEGEFILKRLLKWKADLSLTEYKKLPVDIKNVFDDCLTVKSSQPSLEIVESKS